MELDLKKIHNSFPARLMRLIYSGINYFVRKYSIKRAHAFFSSYSQEDFISGLKQLGINPGDSLFVTCSLDRILRKSGYNHPANKILNDLIEYLGPTGILMVAGYSSQISENIVFDVRKTNTTMGVFSELVRRKKESIRSLSPTHSVIVIGQRAAEFCSEHHMSLYDYDGMSPFRKITDAGGKYLGIGIDFRGFSPCHMVDDYFKQIFFHNIYGKEPISFKAIDYEGKGIVIKKYIRTSFRWYLYFDPMRYFKLLKIRHKKIVTKSGIELFAMNMKEFLDHAICTHRKHITVWNTGFVRRYYVCCCNALKVLFSENLS